MYFYRVELRPTSWQNAHWLVNKYYYHLLLFLLETVAIEICEKEGTYTGELNDEGEAHGEGFFKSKCGLTWNATFRLNKPDGFCKYNFSKLSSNIYFHI